jgi:hypothetical protein
MIMRPVRLPELPTTPDDLVVTRAHAKARIELPGRRSRLEESPLCLFHDGAFLTASHPEPVGTVLKLELLLPEGLTLGALAEVVWIRLRCATLDRPSGMAVQIHFVEHGGRRILAEDLPPDWWTPHAWGAEAVLQRSAA